MRIYYVVNARATRTCRRHVHFRWLGWLVKNADLPNIFQHFLQEILRESNIKLKFCSQERPIQFKNKSTRACRRRAFRIYGDDDEAERLRGGPATVQLRLLRSIGRHILYCSA